MLIVGKKMIKILAIDDIRENLVVVKETIEELIPDYLVLYSTVWKRGIENRTR